MTDQVACPRCQIGYLHAETATYSCVHNGMLLSVPQYARLEMRHLPVSGI